MTNHYQTRSEETGIEFHSSIQEAMEQTRKDLTIWKISFYDLNGLRIRLVKHYTDDCGVVWVYAPLMEAVNLALTKPST